MSYVRDGSGDAAAQRRQIRNGVFAIVIILLCLVFLTWAVWPTPPVVIPIPDHPAAKWQQAYGQFSTEHATKMDAIYWMTSKISIEPSADNQGIVVKGKVGTQADLRTLKEEFEKIEPKVPIEWQVAVGN